MREPHAEGSPRTLDTGRSPGATLGEMLYSTTGQGDRGFTYRHDVLDDRDWVSLRSVCLALLIVSSTT